MGSLLIGGIIGILLVNYSFLIFPSLIEPLRKITAFDFIPGVALYKEWKSID